MNLPARFRTAAVLLAIGASTLLPGTALAQSTPAPEPGKWQTSVIVYAYLPAVRLFAAYRGA